jgi:hypothetical protein
MSPWLPCGLLSFARHIAIAVPTVYHWIVVTVTVYGAVLFLAIAVYHCKVVTVTVYGAVLF